MFIYKIINQVQKVFENLDLDWIKMPPEDKIMSLNKSLEHINTLLLLCRQESSILNNIKDDNSNLEIINYRDSEESKNKEKLQRTVKILATAGLANIVQIADLLEISESDADVLMQSWKKK